MTSTPPDTGRNTNSTFAAQLPRNLAANLAYFLANVVIGVLLVPYFISTLGVAAYGLIPLATSVTGYVAIVVQSLNTAVSRFLTVDLQRENYVAANKTFNTALFGLTVVILLMVPVILLVAYFAPAIFNVPAGQETGAALLFLGVSAAFLIRSWSGNFTVQLFAYNRLDLQNYVNLANLLVQTGLIVLLFTVLGPDLGLVGGAYLAGAVVASAVSIVLARRVCPYLHVSLHSFDRRRVKDLCGMGWWVVINQVGVLLFLQIDLIVVNMLFGANSAGEYAIALQLLILLQAVSGAISGVLTPIILNYYANRQKENLIRVAKSAVKLMGLAMALPVGLICGLAPQILTLWVGSDLAFLAPLTVLIIGPRVITFSISPLFTINIAYNQVRVPGLVTFIMGIGNFCLAIALPLLTGWGYYGVAAAGAIVLTLKNALFTPWYATKVLKVNANTFTRSILLGIPATILIGISAVLLGNFLCLPIPVALTIAGTVITFIYLAVVWIFCLNKFERRLFESYIPPRLRRVIV